MLKCISVTVCTALTLAGCELVIGIDSRVSFGSGGGGGSGPVCPKLYVSPAGNDESSGCEPTQPKRTIFAAIQAARELGDVEAILICAGTYDEAVTLDVPVDLLGGYACASWTRSETYGHPTFDGVNETRVGGTQLPQALLVTSSLVGAETLVDGLTFLGSSEGDDGSAALRVSGSAAAEIANCRIAGGVTQAINADGSVGLAIDTGARPDVHHNHIDSGSGITFGSGGVGRAAVTVDDAEPSIHDNLVTGGTPVTETSAVTAAAGIIVRGASELSERNGRPLARNDVHGGDGRGQTDGIASAGVMILDEARVDLVDNAIRPGDAVGVAVETRGVQASSTGAIRLLRNRIYGGDLAYPNSPSLGFRVGAWIEGATSLLIENNMIHGGVAQVDFAGGSPSFAVALAAVQGAVVRHNTIYSGPSGYPTVGTALKVNYQVGGLVVQNNILAADGGWNEALYVEPCASLGVFQAFENNLIFNSRDPNKVDNINQLFGYGGSPGGTCGPWQGFQTLDQLVTHLTGSVPVLGGNVTLRATCAAEPGCIPWAGCESSDSLACLQSVFPGWTSSDNGVETLFGEGWKLAPSVPCAVAQGTLELGGVTVDHYGIARTAPTSMGAHELDGSCTP